MTNRRRKDGICITEFTTQLVKEEREDKKANMAHTEGHIGELTKLTFAFALFSPLFLLFFVSSNIIVRCMHHISQITYSQSHTCKHQKQVESMMRICTKKKV